MELFQQQWDCIGKFFQVGIDWWYVIVHIHIFNNIIKYFQWERKQWWKRFLLFTFSRHHYILIFRCIWNDILIVFFFRFPIIHRRCWWLRLSIILSLRQRLVRIVIIWFVWSDRTQKKCGWILVWVIGRGSDWYKG